MAVKLVSPRLLAYRKVWWSPDGEHLAYISGGDADGNVSKNAAGPQQLIVCNWKTGKEQIVLEDRIGLKLGLEWKDAQTFLYSDIGEDASLNSNLKEEKKASPPVLRPNIYVYSLATRKSQILVKDGQKPSISPNKQWIAFYGSEDPKEPFALNQDWWLRPGGAALSLANELGGERKPLSVMSGLYPFIMWSHDSRFLVSLSQVKGSPHASAQIKKWNIDTGEQRLISTITANDFEEVPRKPTYPQIYPLGISKDNKKLFVMKQEFRGKTGSWLNEISYLQSLDLATGGIQEISVSETPFGLDWLDLSDDIPD